MSEFKFNGVWGMKTSSGNYLSTRKSDQALWESGEGQRTDPANAFNVYLTPYKTYIFQSQLNGMYLGLCANSDLACFNVPEPSQSQHFIPEDGPGGTVLYVPGPPPERGKRTKQEFLGKRRDGNNWSYKNVDVRFDHFLSITKAWNLSQLPQRVSRDFGLNHANLASFVFPINSDLSDANFSDANLDEAKLDQCNLSRANFTNCSLNNASLKNATLQNTIFDKAKLNGAKFTAGSWVTVSANGAILNDADLSGATLTRTQLNGATLNKANLTNANLSDVKLSGAILDEAILNEASLIDAELVDAKLKKTNLRKATLTNTKLSGAILDEANLTDARLTNADFTGASLNKTDLTNTEIQVGEFSKCDLRTPILNNTKFVHTREQRLSFNSAKLNFSLINYNWEWIDLRNATIEGMPQPLSSAERPLKASGAKLSGLNGNNLRSVTLKHAVLDNSILDHLDLSDAHLSGGSLIEARLQGATLTNVKLDGANLTGAQFGALDHLFALPTGYETHLNSGAIDAALRDQFAQQGVTLSANATLNTVEPKRVWALNDAANQIVYTIRLKTESGGGPQILIVYRPGTAASMVQAYMPDAVMTGANLYGVLGNNIQFYGSKARLDGSAILEEAQLNNSNLSNLNLTQAQLRGTNLSGSHLFNAKFNKATLTPSAKGVATNLSEANLQGADFTGAQLHDANLTNAAVAINVPTKANPNQGGVYLFSLPFKGDGNSLPEYVTELNAAGTLFSLNPDGDEGTLQLYLSALEAKDLAPLKSAFLKHHPPVTLSNNAQIRAEEQGTVWQIVDGQKTYTLWTNVDEKGHTQLYAAPSLTKTRAAFQKNQINLRWQTSAAVDKANEQWLLDNDSESPKNFSLGYVRFVVVVNGKVIDVYGTALRIERLGDKSQLHIDTETCNVTALKLENMNGETVCPNGAKLSTNQQRTGVQWDKRWLHAATPPRPPTCVPTDFSWCPPPQALNKKRGA